MLRCLTNILSVLIPLGRTETSYDVYRLLYRLRNNGGTERFVNIVPKSVIPTPNKPQYIYGTDKSINVFLYIFHDNALMLYCDNKTNNCTWRFVNLLHYKCCIVIGIFHWHKILPIALWPWGRLRLWQKWIPGAFPPGYHHTYRCDDTRGCVMQFWPIITHLIIIHVGVIKQCMSAHVL